jgi:hypothetical protein
MITLDFPWYPGPVSQDEANFTKHHYGDAARSLKIKGELCAGKKRVIDIGPGGRPYPEATTYCGRGMRDLLDKMGRDGNRKSFVHVDFERPLTFSADILQEHFDVAICSHVIEDLLNPDSLLDYISAISASVYIETPSPVAELCVDTDSAVMVPWKGYRHHNWVCWTDRHGVLNLIRKHQVVEFARWRYKGKLLNELLVRPDSWVNRHVASGTGLSYKIWRHEEDYSLIDAKAYLDILTGAMSDYLYGRDPVNEFLQ